MPLPHKHRYLVFEILFLVLAICSGAVLLWTIVNNYRDIVLIVLVTCVFIGSVFAGLRLIMDPERIRATNSSQMLALASETLEMMGDGLNPDSAQRICELLLPATSGIAVAITDNTVILGYAGISEEGNPSDQPIRTLATKQTLDDGRTRIMLSPEEIGFSTDVKEIKAAIIVPLKVSRNVVGTLKFYYAKPHHINETQQSIAEGFGEILSTQLAAVSLEAQKKLATSMELKALQSQINPHFLFNTLNTIAAFIRIDPDKARTLLRDFSTFYRKTLEDSADLIALSREVDQTKRYFSFELARFGEDRLSLETNVPPELEDIAVPAFMVQPIVENSVRHAMPSEGKLNIRIDVRSERNDLFIVIRDNGIGMSEEVRQNIMHAKSDTGLGIAIKNINERVTGYFGPESTMTYESEEGVGTTVTLFLEDAIAPTGV